MRSPEAGGVGNPDTLSPDGCTAIVHGVGSAQTGMALVEVYALK